MLEQITAMLAIIGVLSLLCQWVGWGLRLPAILPLLLCGLILGPGLGFLNPDELFGDLLFPIISLGVAIILFEGALTLNFSDIKNHGVMVTRLVTLGTLITWCCISTATYYLFNFTWPLAILFGALVVVTGPTVIVPMLRSVRPKPGLASILRWEGIIIDPIGALLAVLVFEYLSVSSAPANHILQALATMLVIGFGLGWLAGFALGALLKSHFLPHYLRNTATLTLMLAVFVASNHIQEESGLLSVTVMGIVLANIRNLDISDIIEFKETLTVLLISALFILLAARLNSSALLNLGWQGLALLGVVMFIARPISIWCCGAGTSLTSSDKWFLSWVAPRGIVAAAVSSLFAIKLEAQGIAGASSIVPLVFLIIIGTVVTQSLTAGIWANILGVKTRSPQGLLIFGASLFSRGLAKILIDKKIHVTLADNNWDNIKQARMENIPVYFGNPTSEHAELHLDLSPIGQALIVSPYRQLNPLVNYHYQTVLGSHKVFGLNNRDPSNTQARHQFSESYLQRLRLFGEAISYSKLAAYMAHGAIFKGTQLTDNFTYTDFRNSYGETALPLLYIKDERVTLITAENQNEIPDDIELISLLPKDAQLQAQQASP